MKPKSLIALTALLAVPAILTALGQSAPQLINYQGRLTNSVGQPLDGVTVDMTFTFYGAESGGTAYLSILQQDVLVTGGVYNVLLGSGAITPGTESTLADVFKKHTDVWTGVKVDAEAEMTPRQRITSVPYALVVSASFIDNFINAQDYDGDLHNKMTRGGDDCDDGNPSIYPGAPELCDGIDNQCSGDLGYGFVDEGCPGGCTDVDTDGRFVQPGCGSTVDCDDNDPNNWVSCSICVDGDGDGEYSGCDAYVTINEDCNDADQNNWDACATCLDGDHDLWYQGCDAFITINGPDCIDTDPAHWLDCGSCSDADGDDYGALCDLGPDCDDNLETGAGCHNTCSDFYSDLGDGDGYGDAANILNRCTAPTGYLVDNSDCAPTDTAHWHDCDLCVDADGDNHGENCDLGPDCDDSLETGAACTSGCITTYRDSDSDTYGDAGVNAERCSVIAGWVVDNSDCDDGNENVWDTCATCIDNDTDGWYGLCNQYNGINGPDCDDIDPNNWQSCSSCIDWDIDTYFAGCDTYITINGPDCNDYDISINPGATEIKCDGVDQDCDGFDAGPEKLESDLRITSSPADNRSPSICWTGSEFGISWCDNREGNSEIYFSRISSESQKIESDFRVTNNQYQSDSSSISWTGSEFGLTWADTRNGSNAIYFVRISSSGTKIGSENRITFGSGYSISPFMQWTGTEFAVSWTDYRDGNDEIYFARISPSGTKIGGDLRLTASPSYSRDSSLAWTGSEFGVSWTDNRDSNQEIYFARISASGSKIGNDVRLTSAAGSGWYSSLTWTTSEFGVAWADNRYAGNCTFFARISPEGDKIDSDLPIACSPGSLNKPSISWIGSEFGLSWVDDQGSDSDIFLSRISTMGIKIEPDLRVTNAPGYGMVPVFSWSGVAIGLSWVDNRDANNEIYFVRIGGCQD